MTQQQTQTLNNAFDMASVGDAPISLIRHLVRSKPLRQVCQRNMSAAIEPQLAVIR